MNYNKCYALAFRWGHEDASGASTYGGYRLAVPVEGFTDEDRAAYLAGHLLALIAGANACLMCRGDGEIQLVSSYAPPGPPYLHGAVGYETCACCGGSGTATKVS